MPEQVTPIPATPAPIPSEVAYQDNAAKIAAEVMAKLSEPAAPVVDTVSPVVEAAPAAPIVAPVLAPTPVAAPDPFQEKLLARLADMEKRLADTRKPEATQPAAVPAGIDPQRLMFDLPGVLKEAGIPPEYAARALLGAVSPESLGPEARAQAATQTEFARMRQEFSRLAQDNAQLKNQLARGEYRTQAQEYVASEIKAESYPAVAAAMKNDAKYVMGEVMRIAQEDARERVRKDPNAQPISPADAVKQLEDRLQATARLLGATVGTPTAQPAAVVPPAASKPVPITPAASAISPAAPSTGSPPVTWEAFQEQVRAEVLRKYEIN